MAGDYWCMICGKLTKDPHTCDRCGNDVCSDCYDEDDDLCLKCMQEQ